MICLVLGHQYYRSTSPSIQPKLPVFEESPKMSHCRLYLSATTLKTFRLLGKAVIQVNHHEVDKYLLLETISKLVGGIGDLLIFLYIFLYIFLNIFFK